MTFEAVHAFLVAGAAGIRAAVLLGQRTAEEAVASIDRQPTRVFTATSR
ncbi:hypothetical protein HS041_02165 [Planomonospora sp. ID67723]|nr:hypothetical protein [Planomonospora sp. ID67723]MBG0826580.1 hypothetical protein [Planomonospora sp. ID67723]